MFGGPGSRFHPCHRLRPRGQTPPADVVAPRWADCDFDWLIFVNFPVFTHICARGVLNLGVTATGAFIMSPYLHQHLHLLPSLHVCWFLFCGQPGDVCVDGGPCVLLSGMSTLNVQVLCVLIDVTAPEHGNSCTKLQPTPSSLGMHTLHVASDVYCAI